jgi:hypothetical protein
MSAGAPLEGVPAREGGAGRGGPMEKRAQPPRRRKKAPAKIIIGVQVSQPTRQRENALRKVFAAKAIAILGLAPGGSYTNQMPIRKRRRPR